MSGDGATAAETALGKGSTRRGPVVLPGIGVEERAYVEVDGTAIIEGDIEVRPVGAGAGSGDPGRPPVAAAVTIGDVRSLRWPRGIVPYRFAAAFPAGQRSEVHRAMAHWALHCPVRFVARTASNAARYPDYVELVPSTGCSSPVGRVGGRQVVRLAPGCGFGGTVHELGHVLGLWHEQARADRDQWVRILSQNITPGHEHNFAKRSSAAADVGPYDYGSVMHYDARAFSRNGQPTVAPLHSSARIGQRASASHGDIAAVTDLYRDDLLLYDPYQGQIAVMAVEGGAIAPVGSPVAAPRGWTTLVAGAFGTATTILGYDPYLGQGQFRRPTGRGRFQVAATIGGWRRSWEHIVAGRFGGDGSTDLLFYDRVAGEAEIYAVDANLGMTILRRHTGLRRSWTAIVPVELGVNRHSGLLFHDRITGQAELHQVQAGGGLALVRSYTGFRTTWRHIVAGRFGGLAFTDTGGGSDDLLFYDPVAGQIELYHWEADGDFRLIRRYDGQPASWGSIVAGNFDASGYSDLVLYDPAAGTATVRSAGRGGVLQQRSTRRGLRRSWTTLLAGHFS